MSVEIHEFSTGIRPDGTPYNWVSRGFTGQYMNATIDPPRNVLRSIANKEFAVAEGASSNEPAIIGRVVAKTQEGDYDWSVVAIVTRGRDEKGRSVSVYRYFLSKGADALPKILAWINQYNQENSGMPAFNPFEQKTLDSPNESRAQPSPIELPDELESWLAPEKTPAIFPPENTYSLEEINQLATEKAKTNGRSVAWAYKVEALEQPLRFQVIQAASQKAYKLLKRAKPSGSQVTTAAIAADEQAIKSAIQVSINSSRVKPEHIGAIDTALGSELPEQYWQEIFDGEGAAKGLTQAIYSPDMVRLLTLRAIVLPETLFEYLPWMAARKKTEEHYKIAAQFQSELVKAEAQSIRDKAYEGVSLLLLRLLNENESQKNERVSELPEVIRLLSLENGLWALEARELFTDLESDLELMRDLYQKKSNLEFIIQDDSWSKIREKLKTYWRSQPYVDPREKYQPWVELFEELDRYRLAACFSWISGGSVPKSIFKKAFGNNADWEQRLYGMPLEKKVNLLDRFWKYISGNKLPFVILFFLLLATVSPVLFVYYKHYFFPGNNRSPESNASPGPHSTKEGDGRETPDKQDSSSKAPVATNSPSPTDRPQDSSGTASVETTSPSPTETSPKTSPISLAPEMTQSEREKAVSRLDQTREAIQEIIKSVESQLPQNVGEEEIINALKNVLGDPTLNYSAILNDDRRELQKEQRRWIEAIYAYQKRKNNENITGYLVPKIGLTNDTLKDDIIKNIMQKKVNNPPPGRG